jgi:hypothetical protein
LIAVVIALKPVALPLIAWKFLEFVVVAVLVGGIDLVSPTRLAAIRYMPCVAPWIVKGGEEGNRGRRLMKVDRVMGGGGVLGK